MISTEGKNKFIHIRKQIQQFLGDDVSEVFDNGDSNIMTPAWTEKIGFSKQSKNKKNRIKNKFTKNTHWPEESQEKNKQQIKTWIFPRFVFCFFLWFSALFFSVWNVVLIWLFLFPMVSWCNIYRTAQKMGPSHRKGRRKKQDLSRIYRYIYRYIMLYLQLLYSYRQTVTVTGHLVVR